MLRARLLPAALLLVFATTSVPCLGQPGAPTPPSSAAAADAETLFHKGRKLANEEDWAGAYDAFMRSQKLRASYDTAGNLGYVAYKLGKFDEAAHYLSLSLRGMPASVSTERRQGVERSLREAMKEVTAVHVQVEPSSTEVFVDGESRRARGETETIFLMPGERVLEARADGFQPKTERIIATKGAERTLELRLQPGETATPAGSLPASGVPASNGGTAPGPDDPTRNGGSDAGVRPKTIVLIGAAALTAVSLGVGIGFGLDAANAKNEADDLRDGAIDQIGPGGCRSNPDASVCTELDVARSHANRSADWSTAGFIAGGVFAAATVATWLLWPDEDRDPDARAQLGFAPTRGGGMATVISRF